MNQITEGLAPGQIARVRQRTYLIEEIVKPRRAALWLTCIDDIGRLFDRIIALSI